MSRAATAAKHAANAVARTLRLELLGRPIRVTEIAPGMVETEFSEVRFGGDQLYLPSEATTPEALAYLRPVTDVYRVDLKAFTEAQYGQLGGRLATVLDAIATARDVHLFLLHPSPARWDAERGVVVQ